MMQAKPEDFEIWKNLGISNITDVRGYTNRDLRNHHTNKCQTYFMPNMADNGEPPQNSYDTDGLASTI